METTAKTTPLNQRDPMEFTRQEIAENAAKFENRSEWNIRGKWFHNAARKQGILNEIMPRKNSAKTKVALTEESVIEVMKEYAKEEREARSKFGREKRDHFKFARDHDLLDKYLPKYAKKSAKEESGES